MDDPTQNHLLALLAPEDLARLRRHMRFIDLPARTSLFAAEEPTQTIYFPVAGVASLMALDADGGAVEMASIGREGMVGLAGALGTQFTLGEVIQQIAGRAATLPADVLRADYRAGGSVASVLERYTTALIAQIGQGVACNRLHDVEMRAARWLLMCHDRVGLDTFALTHEFFAIMLGVARPRVTLVAGILQKAGMIRYTRGRITIVDRGGLESTSCACYQIVRSEFNRLLGTENGWPVASLHVAG